MKKSKAISGLRSKACVAGLLLMSQAAVQATDWKDANGLLDALNMDPNNADFMKNNNLKFGGWIENSISVNANKTHNGYNGPVTFQDKDSQFQMNQLNFFLQKAINVSSDSFDWGGRFDVMYGSDSIFTQAYGNPTYNPHTGLAQPRGNWDLGIGGDQTYQFALPNAYAEFNLPIGNGLDVKAGHFYTPLGYEVVTSPDNFLISKPYTMQYGEPFTHTGVYGTYAFDSNWSIMQGAVTGSSTGGWDGNFNRNMSTWSWLGGGTWTSDDAGSSLNLTATAGPQSDNNSNFWGIYSLVGKHNFTDTLHFVIQHDHGFANQVLTSSNNFSQPVNAQWYGINSYLFYDVNDKVSAGLRAEWFRDQNGFRVGNSGRCSAAGNVSQSGSGSFYSGAGSSCTTNGFMSQTAAPSSYYELTAGLSYKPAKWINLRPNVRFDYADQAVFAVGQSGGGNQHTQFLFSADAVITF